MTAKNKREDQVDFRKGTRALLQANGYTVTEAASDIGDPFAWRLIARKGDYEVVISERCKDR